MTTIERLVTIDAQISELRRQQGVLCCTSCTDAEYRAVMEQFGDYIGLDVRGVPWDVVRAFADRVREFGPHRFWQPKTRNGDPSAFLIAATFDLPGESNATDSTRDLGVCLATADPYDKLEESEDPLHQIVAWMFGTFKMA